MAYKVNDLVYFDDGVQKGVGKVVSQHMDFTNHYQVHSTQFKAEYNGMLLNFDYLWFSEDDLKPFTKKVGQKYKVLRDGLHNIRVGGIATLTALDGYDVSLYKTEEEVGFLYDIGHHKCEVEFYADVEDVKEHKENEMFTKDDLKVGYLIKLRNRQIAHVVNTDKKGMCFNFVCSWGYLDNYNRDLTNTEVDFLDIVEVYGFTREGYNAHKFEIGNRELLWKREEVKEMTIEDIQKVLGHKIKVVE